LKYKIKYFVNGLGEVPFENWFSFLKSKKAKARIDAHLFRMELGNLGDYKSLGNGLHEKRIFVEKGYRIYFCFEKNTIVVIFWGGDKSTQKRDITKARKYLEEYKCQKE
jgi:putative addiction module killer protein